MQASLIRNRFGPSHASRPFVSMAEWSARRTLNQLAPESVGASSIPGGRILNVFSLFRFVFLLEVTNVFLVFSLYFKL